VKKIILISGKAESGKNYCADYIKEKLEQKGYKVAEDMFAKYIKGILTNYYKWDGVTKDDFYRDKLQQLGTDIIKEKLNFKSFHALRLAQDIQIVELDFDYILITDARFHDEIHTMRAMFPRRVMDIRINWTGSKNQGLKQELAQHKSEIDLDDFEFSENINNNGTPEVMLHLDKLVEKIAGDK
jgi:hypothetical protein